MKIHNSSNWLNGAAIISTDTALLDTLHKLSFVKESVWTAGSSTTKTTTHKKFPEKAELATALISDIQLDMLELPAIHESGFKGEGILIGILDAGFNNADEIESTQHVWRSNRVISVKDFIKDGELPLESHYHGTMVFSIIAANWPDNLIGAAPEAEFMLIRTENTNSEYLVEEYNWVSGAEYSDSLGVDIITSSLGYSLFKQYQ